MVIDLIVFTAGELGVGIVNSRRGYTRLEATQSNVGTRGRRDMKTQRLHEEADVYWFIDQGVYWGIVLENSNEHIDILYDEVFVEFLL